MKRSAAAVALVIALANPLAAAAGAPVLHEVVYAVSINGEAVSDGTILLQDASGRIYVREGDLAAWRVKEAGRASVVYEGIRYVVLTAGNGLRERIDAAAGRLALEAEPDALATTELSVRGTPAAASAERIGTRGTFVNYNIHAERGADAALSGLLEGGTRLGGGVLDTSLLAGSVSGGTRVVPLQTFWQHDDVERHQSTVLGDMTTLPNAFGGQVSLIGLRIARNFATEPQLITAPLASVSGSAAVPSVLDVYVNNSLAYSQSVPAGPYRLNDLPIVDGLAGVRLVVRDIQGREQVVQASYYSSASLLRKGLSSFEYDGGFLRTTLTDGAQQYGAFVARGYRRYGFSNRFTGEAAAELAAHDKAAGLAGTVQVGDAGLLHGGLAVSTSALHGGMQATAGYEYASSRGNFGFDMRSANAEFVQAGEVNGQGFQRDVQAHAGLRIGTHGSLGFAYGRQQRGAVSDLRVTTVSFERRLGRDALSVAATKSGGPFGQTSIFASLRMPLGARTDVTSALNTSTGVAAPSVTVDHQSGSATSGIAYQAQVVGGQTGFAFGDVLAHRTTSDFHLSFLSQSGSRMVTGDLTGALSFVDGHIFLSQPIREGWGVAEVAGYPGIHVLEGGETVGVTNRDGLVLLPSLMPYMANEVSLQGKDLPLSANIENVKETVNPTYRLPVIARFKVAVAGGVTVHVVDSAGHALPGGTMVRDTAGHSWPVARDGLLYLGGVHAGRLELSAVSGEQTCRVLVTVPASVVDVPDLGTTVCR